MPLSQIGSYSYT
ncbi:hypothetical protein F383_06640 [Gossypium arboreum]|uniref:Uncharacterized protein n=1 Tax=Gossypium arboreum TaxID=29729 RepID=A0A0B0PFD1_GOSAR|nr:hypothetical protein F383_06640 [Gossypium arboreum]